MSFVFASSAIHPAVHLRIDGISISFRGRRVLTDVSFVVPSGARTGLIGENGSGKSTLLRIAAGLTHPDAGTVAVVGASGDSPRIGLLHQAHAFEDNDTIETAVELFVAPVREALVGVDRAALRFADAPEDEWTANAYADALNRAERLHAWDLEARVSAMLAGLGLGRVPRSRAVRMLSGGQRARLALAGLLLSSPDVLLLDEPTNHLDDAATEYLHHILVNWQGPVLMASHDRAFLDETATSLVDLDPAPTLLALTEIQVGEGEALGIGAVHFTGTYSDYLAGRAASRTRWEAQYRDEQAELKRLRASVRGSQVVGHNDWKPRSEVRMAQKYYADRNAKVVSRRVNDAKSRLADLEARQISKPATVLKFAGLTVATALEHSDDNVPLVSTTSAAIAGRLAPTSLTLHAGERLLVTGANGVGKSTLLHLIAGDLTPTTGFASVRSTARVGLLTQEVVFPDPHRRGADRTAHETYVDLVGVDRAEHIPLSSLGLLAGRDEHRALTVLSLGQQRRLALAVLLAHPPEVLLLDEPTNHLSLLLATELEAAILEYPGVVIVASHDRWLRKRWTGQRMQLERA